MDSTKGAMYKVLGSENVKFDFFLVGYVEERLWWPIQSSNIGRKRTAKRIER